MSLINNFGLIIIFSFTFVVMIWKKFMSYLTFWKKSESGETASVNLKLMHGINKISIVMFLVALVFLVIKFFVL